MRSRCVVFSETGPRDENLSQISAPELSISKSYDRNKFAFAFLNESVAAEYMMQEVKQRDVLCNVSIISQHSRVSYACMHVCMHVCMYVILLLHIHFHKSIEAFCVPFCGGVSF